MLPSPPGAGERVILERGAVIGGDGALGRQRAGRRTARYTLGPDERGDRGLVLIVTHDPDPFRQTARIVFRGIYKGLTRDSFNFTQKGEFSHIILCLID